MFLTAFSGSVGAYAAVSLVDNVDGGRKGLSMVIGGEGTCMNGMVGCVVVELSQLSHGSLFTNFAKFLEPGFETVGLGKGSTNDVWVGIMKHCYAQDMHVRILVDRRWVIIVVVHADHDMQGAVLIGPIGI
jgi:hypothetical protein